MSWVQDVADRIRWSRRYIQTFYALPPAAPTQYVARTDADGRTKVYPRAPLPDGYELRDNEHLEWR